MKLEDLIPKTNDPAAGAATPDPEPTPEPTPTPEPREAKEPKGKQILMSEAEASALRKAADDGARALTKIEASERRAVVEKLTFSSTNSEGRFFPKQAGAVESLLKTFSESQRDAFVQIIKNMPKADTKLFSEIGDGGKTTDGSSASIYSEIKSLVDAKVLASEGKLAFSAALLQVYAEKPELKASYEAARDAEAK
jgi:hypothetical protein